MNSPKAPAEDILLGQVDIRTATAKDIPSIVKLDEKSTGVAKSQYWRQLYHNFDENRVTGRAFLVAEQGGRIIGFITGEIRAFEFGGEPCGWVFSLDVDQDSRAHSVGTKLFESLCDTFRRAGSQRSGPCWIAATISCSIFSAGKG